MESTVNIINVAQENFAEAVLTTSHQRPVLVDFWAAWCAPCKSLMPVLENLAKSYDGKFLLAKVNSDEQQTLAQQYQVRSLPTVKLFVNAEVVDEFIGARAEHDIRALLDNYVLRESDNSRTLAADKLQQGDTQAALNILETAYADDPDNHNLAIELTELYLATKQLEKAEAVFKTLKLEQRESEIGNLLKALLQLSHEQTQLIDSEQALIRLKSNPDDPEALYSYALELVFKKHYSDAMDNLLKLMKNNKNYRENAAQKALLQVFKIAGENSENVNNYRRKMTRLLY